MDDNGGVKEKPDELALMDELKRLFNKFASKGIKYPPEVAKRVLRDVVDAFIADYETEIEGQETLPFEAICPETKTPLPCADKCAGGNGCYEGMIRE